MLRRIAIASLAGTLLLLVPGVARADVPTVVSRVGLPSNWSFTPSITGCVESNPQASATHVTGPGAVPLGAGSLELSAGAGSAGTLQYDLTGDATPSDLTSFAVHSYLPANGAPVESIIVMVLTDSSDSTVSYQGRLSLPSDSPDAWDSVDFIGSGATQWVTDTNGTFGTPTTESYGSFLGGHPTAVLHSIAIINFSCPQAPATPVAGHFYLDDISLTYDSSTVVYNFEAPIATKLVGHLSPTTVTYGHAVTPTATLTSDGAPFADKAVSLWAKPAGAKSYSQVATAQTNGNGTATPAVQHPTVNTAYQWRYAGDDTFAAATSSTLTVDVGSKLSINAPRKVKKGKKFTVAGVMSPKHAGDKITLYATKGGHKTAVATSKVHGDGSYTVTGKLKKKGRYKIFTTAAADSTNAKGTSAQKSLKVH